MGELNPQHHPHRTVSQPTELKLAGSDSKFKKLIPNILMDVKWNM